MDKVSKIKELIKKRNEYKEKLAKLYKNFRGVRRENSLSEIRYSQIRVYEDFIRSLDEEIEEIKQQIN